MSLSNKEYTDLVQEGMYPVEIIVPLDSPFVDERGSIQNIWLGQSGSITFIKSNFGSKRAQHKHNANWHTTFIINGKIKYTELKDDEITIEKEMYFITNDLFFTKPGVFHIMEFLEETTMITINNLIKDHLNYEQDLIRMNIK